MRWSDWEPTYLAILADLGYDRAADEDARDLLDKLVEGHELLDLDAFARTLAGREVVVAGPRPSALPPGPVLASDAASWAFARASAIVTDLDGDVDAQVEANARGVPVFVHAHGDDRDALRRHVPRFRGPILPTTQAEPRGRVLDLGGFTDGDRACCLAAHCGAASLVLVGFDLDEPWPKPARDPATKRRKLRWARRIIDGLGVPYRFA